MKVTIILIWLSALFVPIAKWHQTGAVKRSLGPEVLLVRARLRSGELVPDTDQRLRTPIIWDHAGGKMHKLGRIVSFDLLESKGFIPAVLMGGRHHLSTSFSAVGSYCHK